MAAPPLTIPTPTEALADQGHRIPPVPRRREAIRAFRQQGGRVAAVLPIHYPRALLRAFGLLQVEVWGPPGVDPGAGAAHLQPYVCSIVRNALAFLQTNDAAEADVIVVPHGCDSLQGLGSLLIDFVPPGRPVLPFYLPRGRRESDARFLVDELRALYGRLGAITGEMPSEAALMDCVQREEQADRLLGALARRRRDVPLPQLQFFRVARAREYLPAEAFAALAEGVLAQASPGSAKAGVPVLLSGIVPEPMALLEALEGMGAQVVADDLACCGRRLYPAGTSADPFQRMAESLQGAPPDAMRGDPIAARLEHLLGLAREAGAAGVVFYGVKFCEPELFYLPALRRGLQQAGLPSAAVEVDIGAPVAQQTLNRLEAFVEMIG